MQHRQLISQHLYSVLEMMGHAYFPAFECINFVDRKRQLLCGGFDRNYRNHLVSWQFPL